MGEKVFQGLDYPYFMVATSQRQHKRRRRHRHRHISAQKARRVRKLASVHCATRFMCHRRAGHGGGVVSVAVACLLPLEYFQILLLHVVSNVAGRLEN